MKSKNGLISIREAAQLLGISQSTLKRMADQGLVRAQRTPGGHRRFSRSDLLAARQVESDGLGRWLDRLLSAAPVALVQAALLEEYADRGSWREVAEFLGRVLHELGESWARGECSVASEHYAVERLHRALASCADSIPVATNAPTCLLATLSGDSHTLGLSLVEIALRELGWHCHWVGAPIPMSFLSQALDEREPDLVVVTASSFSDNRRAIAKEYEHIASACEERAISLVMGGNGAWPENPRYGKRLREFRELTEIPHSRARRSERGSRIQP